MIRRALLAAVLAVAAPAQADSQLPPATDADRQLADPAQERQARRLMETLRCLVCQGQSIADSDAEIAGDMRAVVRQRIAAGQTPAQVRRWLIDRYGAYVTYDPPMTAQTAPLWLAPLAMLIVGGLIAARSFKRRRR